LELWNYIWLMRSQSTGCCHVAHNARDKAVILKRLLFLESMYNVGHGGFI